MPHLRPGRGARPRLRHFHSDDFQYGLELALGDGIDPGEALAIAARIADGDADAWVREWSAAAESATHDADAAEEGGHRRSALLHLGRAATAHSAALYLIAHSEQADDALEMWRRMHACWERIVDLREPAGERIAIPYEDTPLSAWFFRAPDAAPGEPRPLLVMNNGSDGATSSMPGYGGDAAAARGWHWLAFDGPGQQSALFEQGLHFRPDWEAVLTPVVDAMVARPDVDAERLAVVGISQAGYWVPRALAFEHRFAAAVVDPGVVDVSASWTRDLPARMLKMLDAGEREKFDKQMGYGLRFNHDLAGTLRFRAEPYGIAPEAAFDLYTEVLRYRLGDEVAQITTPLLITDPEGEQFWPGQPQQLHDRLTGERELVRFTGHEGADRHCEPMAPALREARIFDWLEDRLG